MNAVVKAPAPLSPTLTRRWLPRLSLTGCIRGVISRGTRHAGLPPTQGIKPRAWGRAARHAGQRGRRAAATGQLVASPSTRAACAAIAKRFDGDALPEAFVDRLVASIRMSAPALR